MSGSASEPRRVTDRHKPAEELLVLSGIIEETIFREGDCDDMSNLTELEELVP
jgi:hypothetical protein